MKKYLVAVGLSVLTTSSSIGVALAETVPRIEVRGSRVHAKELVPSTNADIDLGATPPVGSSRVIDRAEIERAFAGASLPAPKKIPAAVRVARKTRRLSPSDVNAAVKTALADMKLPRGAALSGVRANAVEVPADFQKVSVDFPTLPRKAGTITVYATVTFLNEEGAPITKAIAPIDFILPADAAFAEITKGAPITLLIRKGLVEVSIGAVAASDGDVGSIVPITLKPSGRVLRARAIDKDHAVAIEE